MKLIDFCNINFIKIITIISFLFSQSYFSQENPSSHKLRENLPQIKINRTTNAPGYCESNGGSTTFERISNVNVLEKPGNRLDISVDVFIANPSGCVSGEPCGVYDGSPEFVNVWIDWDGDFNWEPHELVLNQDLTGYNNINYSGTMTAKQIVEIPPNAKRPTWLRANLGWSHDPQNPCELNWSFGNVIDQQVLWGSKVQKITATLDIQIPDIPKPLWQGTYDQLGNLLNVINQGPIVAGMKNGFFTMPVNLVSFPNELGENSRTDCNWEIVNTGIKGKARIIGKSGVVSISLPKRIGMYDLKLQFIFKDENNSRIGEQIITMPLWVSYDKPSLSNSKKLWLQKAIEWANGATNDNEIAQRIMDGIYSKSGWKYYTNVFLWSDLFDGKAPRNGGNCNVMARVWLNLMKVLGVGGVSTVHHSGRNTSLGFMVNPNFTAFGDLDSAPGNAEPSDFSLYNYDRWVFASHTFGKKGSIYYDPTFNKSNTDFYFHHAHDVIKKENTVWTTSPGGPTLWTGTAFSPDEGSWGSFTYQYPANEQTGLLKVAAVGAMFSGSFTEMTIDSDNDGHFDQLTVSTSADVIVAKNYSVSGFLMKNDSIITSRPYLASPTDWFQGIGSQIGLYEINSTFSGEDIFSNMEDGPFKVKLFITDSIGTLIDVDSFNTSAYSFSDFGEVSTRINQLSEAAADLNGDALFDEIKAELDIESTVNGNFTVVSSIRSEDNILVSNSENFDLVIGNNIVSSSLPTKPLAISGIDGPYTLAVQISNSFGDQNIHEEIQTTNYSISQFSPLEVKIIGDFSDNGIDINSNSLFDSLKVSFNVESLNEGNYSVIAWLTNQNDDEITLAESNVSLAIGTSSVMLSFPGAEINKSEYDGKYKIGSAIIRDSSSVLYSGSNLYNTQSYDHTQFEEEAQIITFEENYSESVIDTATDGLIDFLVIELGVTPRDSGNVVALGRLVDSNNETILWSSAIEFLDENIPQNLSLKFDGRYIFGSQMNGPYQLKDLQIYHVGEPTQSIDIVDAYTTQQYSFEDFEPAGVISGSVMDNTPKGVGNAFLIIDNVDNDFSNAMGNYNIVSVDSGQYVLKIEGPDTLNLDWDIYVDGEFANNGDSVLIDVTIGNVTNVNFVAPIEITDIRDEITNKELPVKYYLNQNYPNPFNPATTINYLIPERTNVQLKVFNLLGKEIITLVNAEKGRGNYSVEFDATGLTSGIYFYNIKTEKFIDTKKMILLK